MRAMFACSRHYVRAVSLLSAALLAGLLATPALAQEQQVPYAQQYGFTIYHPSGEKILTFAADMEGAFTDSLLEIDVATGATRMAGPRGENSTLAYSPDGTQILTCWEDVAVLWDAATGERIRDFGKTNESPAEGDDGLAVYRPGFSPDGSKIIGLRSDGLLIVWNKADGEELYRLGDEHLEIPCYDFTAQGETLVTGTAQGQIILWNFASGERSKVLSGHAEGVWVLSCSPDGKRAVSASLDASLLWDLTTGESTSFYEVGSGDDRNIVTDATFSPTGEILVTGGMEIIAWDVATGERLQSYEVHEILLPVLEVSFHPNGKEFLAQAYGFAAITFELADPDTSRSYAEFPESTYSRALSADGSLVATGSTAGIVRVWSTETGELLSSQKVSDDWVWRMCFDPDGDCLLVALEEDSTKLLDWRTGEVQQQLDVESHIQGICFTPDGEGVYFGHNNGRVTRWDIASGIKEMTYLHQQDRHTGPMLSEDGTRLITWGNDYLLWDAETGERLWEFSTLDIKSITSAAFANQRPELILCSRSQGIVLIEYENVELKIRWIAPKPEDINNWITAVTYSPDGSRFVTGSEQGEVFVWDAARGEPLRQFAGYTEKISRLAFSNDGSQIIALGGDDRVIMWNSETGEELRSFSVDPLENE